MPPPPELHQSCWTYLLTLNSSLGQMETNTDAEKSRVGQAPVVLSLFNHRSLCIPVLMRRAIGPCILFAFWAVIVMDIDSRYMWYSSLKNAISPYMKDHRSLGNMICLMWCTLSLNFTRLTQNVTAVAWGTFFGSCCWPVRYLGGMDSVGWSSQRPRIGLCMRYRRLIRKYGKGISVFEIFTANFDKICLSIQSAFLYMISSHHIL